MKQARGLFFLAVILSTAAPGFADQIPADRMDRDRGSVSMQGLFHEKALQDVSALRHFGLNALKEDEFQIESIPYVRMSDLTKDGRIAILVTHVSSGPGSNDRQVRLFDIDSRGDRFGRNEKKAHRKHNGRDRGDGDGPVSIVATPEPGSRTLLLFGLTGLGMVFYRRNWLRNAI